MKLILTDIDDTLLSFGEAFKEWLHSEGYQTLYPTLHEAGGIVDFVGCTRAEADVLVTRFSNDKNQMGAIPAEPCAKAVVPALSSMGYEFIAISSCPTSDDIVQWRAENLENELGVRFAEVHCVGLGEAKSGLLSDYKQRNGSLWWVEDNAHHAVVGAELGHRSLIIDRPYNSHVDHPAVRRVTNWHHVFEVVVKND